MKKSGAALFLLIMGVIALVFGIMDMKKQNTYLSTDAVITRIDMEEEWVDDELQTTYRPWVRYTVDGVEHEGELGYYENGYQEGKTITIKYNPEDATDITGDSKGFATYLIILGPVLMVAAVFVFMKRS